MNGIKQLFKGVVIGVVILLAVIGLLNISGKNNNKVLNDINNANHSGNSYNNTSAQNDIKTPSINIKQSSKNSTKQASDNNTDNDNSSIEATDTSSEDTATATFKPEIIEQPVSYGTLKLAARLTDSGNAQNVDFIIFDENNKRVANSNDSSTASFRLKTGQYKAIAQYANPDNNNKQTLTLDITIEKDKAVNQVFSIKPAISTGILQVSAVSGNNNQATKTDFIIQDQQGKRVAIRQHVASTLFKLKSGIYKITAMSNGMSVERNITIEPDSSYKEVFKLTDTAKNIPPKLVQRFPAKILLRAIDENSNTPLKADFTITQQNGKFIKRFAATPTAELSLAAGEYQIQATGPNGQTSRNITLESGQTLSETFRFKIAKTKDPEPEIITQKPHESTSGEISNNVPEQDDVIADINDSVATNNTPTKDVPEIKNETTQAMLRLKTVDSETKKPIKSNFYVQTLNGINIVNKIYADSASFKLDKGVYKITVKSSNKKTVSKTVSIDQDSRINRIFSMVTSQPQKSRPIQQTTQNVSPGKTQPAMPVANEPYYSDNTNKPSKPVRTPPSHAPSNGTLLVAMYPARNHKTSRNTLLSNFLIKTRSGKKIAMIKGVQHAKVKLDVGDYVVTAIHKNKKKSTAFKIRRSQNTTVNFNAANFRSIVAGNRNNPRNNRNRPAGIAKGMLRSRVVDQHGRPLKGNLLVTNRNGKVVRRANNVSSANFELPAKSFIIKLNYRGLMGSERVNIIPGETTIQTFTISQ